MTAEALSPVAAAAQSIWKACGGWLRRFALVTVTMVGWLYIVVSWIALLSPAFVDRDGVATLFSLPVLFGAITAVYYLTLIPMLIFPVRDEERFEWFFYSALSWVLCLVASLAALTVMGLVGFVDISLPMGPRGIAGLVAILFIAAMALLFSAELPSRHRLYGLCALLLGWFSLQGSQLWVMHFGTSFGLPLLFRDEFRGIQLLALLMLSLLWIFLVCGQLLPAAAQRRDVVGFLMLSWLFFVAAILCYQMTHGQIQILGGTGWEVFVCLVISAFFAPFASWLGVPGHRGNRGAWITCLLLAAIVTLMAATWLHFPGSDEGILRHIWLHYDGDSIGF